MFDTITSFLKTHESNLLQSQQRLAVAFHESYSENELAGFINNLWFENKLIISPKIENSLAPERAVTKLGEEYDLVVFDVRESFYPDALGIVSGVLCGGGYLIILLPQENKWDENDSLFLSHVKTLLNYKSGIYYFIKNRPVTEVLSLDVIAPINEQGRDNSLYRTHDQKSAVESMFSSIKNNDAYCCVLTSGRGRGKSSALGLLSALLIEQQDNTILISAPKLSVAEPLFEHLHNQCSEGVSERSAFKYKKSSVSFIAPDLLLETLPVADVLLIDEAAVIPLSMLQRLLRHYSKIIFSTTTHGYEGTGRGFILKFYTLLDETKPGWDKIELHQPVRWARHDPLEKWIEEMLFLNLKLTVKPEMPGEISDCHVSLIDRSELLVNKNKLAEIFSLLVFAHYRTSPSDFQYLLDSEDVRIYSLEFNGETLGIVVVNQEGGFDSALSTAIYRGERRPKGNLLAQTLCYHGGSEQAATLRYARVMRIAIHPQLQQSGLGSYLLTQVISKEKKLGMDIFGSSFSATADLLDFWNKAGLSMLRLGFSRDHVTASHSAVMAKALTDKGVTVIDELSLKFRRNISLWLQGPLSDLTEEIKNYILLQCQDEESWQLTKMDLDDIGSFSKFNRNYDACMPAITRYIKHIFTLHDDINEVLSDQQMEIINLNQKYTNDWKMVVSKMRDKDKTCVNSKNQAIKLLRSSIGRLQDFKFN
ncbi:MAG: hypothetical protein DIZ80_15045 [endosymbiont of Galathealinum brachiosum]|uniref:N-acetyltransferase domain-containing protein n=1 Tax=endosymbiont of Galathealinum brachiosum TaxID=2200906 RepID=A0A370D936_9GAMM|nr:MAG: hypothetical protein DIZ80_15045 [endosymbiont of Galathealinum brachiosum]